ncbi:MAG: CUAEP/CCAEP-tail radical SAM protein [Bryobacteraceae bacterium]
MKVLLISTYELGRQPFGLASPAAWLRDRGFDVACADLSRTCLPLADVETASLIAFYLPMHTATRLAIPVLEKVRLINPRAHVCCYGLYAPMNESLLRERGASTILGGEFERDLADLAERLSSGATGDFGHTFVSLDRLQFVAPDRSSLPPLSNYATLNSGGNIKTVGYTEASRGCRHLCRHCPVVPIYNGAFRVVQHEVVLEDIRRQVAAGAQHITFGDPDFFNGPGHAMRLVRAFHAEHPTVTYDVTIKVEHLLRHRELLPTLRDTGCAFVISAVESIDDRVLEIFDKGHTRRDFAEVAHLLRDAGLTLSPTFVTFTPWTTLEGYRELLGVIAELDLIENVAPIQLGIRLLIPAGSRLLELEEVRRRIGAYDQQALSYRWRHEDASMDSLCSAILTTVQREERARSSRAKIFERIWEIAHDAPMPDFHLAARATIPYLNEPWYC